MTERTYVPPHDLDAETGLLAAMLWSPDMIDGVRAAGVTPADFYRLDHQYVAAAMFDLADDGDGVFDVVTVRGKLNGQASAETLARLDGFTTTAPTTSMAPKYASIVLDCAHRRRIITRCADVQKAAYEGTPVDEPIVALLDTRVADATVAAGPVQLDWHELFARTDEPDEWLVDGLWPARRAISLVADKKAGKSLFMFWVCCCLARGVDPWTGKTREPLTVAYWDWEMTEDDVHERALDFGLSPDDLDRFVYFLLPDVPPLDTPEGGRVVLATVRGVGAAVTAFDTFGRAVDGEENTSDTVRAYYRHTAVHLKRAGIASARLDHTGHNDKHRARGASGKGDDIDVAWLLRRQDGNGVTLNHHGVSRLRWVPQTLELTLVEGPPDHYRRALENWPEGTKHVAELLDDLGVPVDAGSRPAGAALREAGHAAAQRVVQAAQKYRRTPRPDHPETTP